MKEALSILKQTIPFVESEEEKTAYETPWRGGERGHAAILFFPETTLHIQAIVQACYTHHWPIIPQGGNTGLVFGSTPPKQPEKPPVIINLRYMKKVIRAVDPTSQTVIVESGMVLENFKALMESQGYVFSVDMGSKGSAQLGGAASTNAGGTNFLRYGGMREQVVGLKVVLPNGELLDTMTQVQKDNTGFPLTPLFLGAEGTLGIITELQLKLHHPLKQKETAFIAVASVDKAVELLLYFKQHYGDWLSAFELISAEAYQLVVSKPGMTDPFAGQQVKGEPLYSHYILVEFTSVKAKQESCDLERILMAEIEKAFESGLVQNAVVDKPHILWGIRENITESANHAGLVVPNDISVPITKIPVFLTQIAAEIANKWPDLQLKPAYFGHLGDGNLHYNLVQPKGISPKLTPVQKQEIEDYIAQRVIAVDGSPIAEHGIGRKNIHAMQLYKNPVALATMMQIKQALDPRNIMNPYVIFGSKD